MTLLAPISVDIEKISGQLAMDLVAKLKPPEEVLAKYGLTVEELDALAKTPQFRLRLKEAQVAWNSDDHAPERIKQKATTLVEDSLITIYQMIHDDLTTASTKLESFRTLAKMAGVVGDVKGEGSGARFSVSIDLGGDKSVTIEGSSEEVKDED